MTTIQVQVRIPDELVKELDRWIAEGKFSTRSEAIKTIVALYNERERTRKFYQTLQKRSAEARKNPRILISLEDVF
ncbi:MAG: ribbon-helix-helix domain-containing protein [Nitrososphaerales archaeon]|nr:ribbon-helix-helix domain-containing protein [Nitrososphaerales archaeon]